MPQTFCNIILTGPESTGKTSLCDYLAEKHQYPIFIEYARVYLQNLNRSYNFGDLKHIARVQADYIDPAPQSHIIHDTDILTLHVWAKERFGKDDFFIMYLNQLSYNKHYLLCEPDIKWTYDALRENPNDRDRLFEVYKDILITTKANFTIIHGSGKVRNKNADKAITRLITQEKF